MAFRFALESDVFLTRLASTVIEVAYHANRKFKFFTSILLNHFIRTEKNLIAAFKSYANAPRKPLLQVGFPKQIREILD